MNFGGKAVYLCCGATDLRKSFNGLLMIVKHSFELDPFTGALFVFCNKKRGMIKILEWDTDGFWLYCKRLEKGCFKWPQVINEPTMTLTGEDLHMLLGGVRVELKIKRNEVLERNIS